MRVHPRNPQRSSLLRPLPLTAMLVLLAIVIAVITYFRSDASPVDTPVPATSSAAATPAPSASRNYAAEFAKLDNQAAQRTWERNIWHYMCRKYPAASVLQTTDLVPTGNVVATINYNTRSKQYEPAQPLDERIKLTWEDKRERIEGSKRLATLRTFTWSYRDKTVKHYGLAKENASASGIYFNGRQMPEYDTQSGKYSFTAVAENGLRTPTYWIIATDEASCEYREKSWLSDSWWRETAINASMEPDKF